MYWYHLVTVENDGYMAVFLKNKMVLEVNPFLMEEQYDRLEDAVNPFVEWLTASVKCCIKQMQEGIYNEYVKNHLTPENGLVQLSEMITGGRSRRSKKII